VKKEFARLSLAVSPCVSNGVIPVARPRIE
jgi:hypothetical protein